MIMRIALLLVVALMLPATAEAGVTATLTPTTVFASSNRQVDAGPGTARTYTPTRSRSGEIRLDGADARRSSRRPIARAWNRASWCRRAA
jgi:hypothetical protein